MGKAAGMAALVTVIGAGAMTAFGGFLGAYAECAALGLMGLGLLGGSQLLARPPASETGLSGKQATNP